MCGKSGMGNNMGRERGLRLMETSMVGESSMGKNMVKVHTLHKMGQKGKESSRIIHLGIFLFMVNTEILQGNM